MTRMQQFSNFKTKALRSYTTDISCIELCLCEIVLIFGSQASLKLIRSICFRVFQSTLGVNSLVGKSERLALL